MADTPIRPAEPRDLPALARIYDHYIVNTAITFDLEPFGTEGRRAWFEGFRADGRHRLLVADPGDGAVGYACSHTFRPKGAYATSIEARPPPITRASSLGSNTSPV